MAAVSTTFAARVQHHVPGDTLAIGLTASDGVIIAACRKNRIFGCPNHDINRVEMLSYNLGIIHSGMDEAYCTLVQEARVMILSYYLRFGVEIPVSALAYNILILMGVRGLHINVLLCGWQLGGPILYNIDHELGFFKVDVAADGAVTPKGCGLLNKCMFRKLSVDELIYYALDILKANYVDDTEPMSSYNVQLGICNRSGFLRLDNDSINEYLQVLNNNNDNNDNNNNNNINPTTDNNTNNNSQASNSQTPNALVS